MRYTDSIVLKKKFNGFCRMVHPGFNKDISTLRLGINGIIYQV